MKLLKVMPNDPGLLACENTMRNTKTQREGWAYVRP